MKRLLVCLLLVGVVGCGKSERAQKQSSGKSDQEAQQPSGNIQPEPTTTAKTPDAATVKKQMTPAQLALGDPVVNSVGMLLVPIPAGTFMMGTPETEKLGFDNEHQHQVTISNAFYMQTTEVTQGQWKAAMGTEPWKSSDRDKEGANYPATCVSWEDAVAYCEKLSAKEGKTYRLPTEAQWEYACRAGTKTIWSFGNDENQLGEYAWYRENTRAIGEGYAHQVGQKKPNAFGLYDMHGNVWEWCHDYYGEGYYKPSPATDPQGPAWGVWHLFRGGSWQYLTRGTRSAERGAHGEGLISPEVFGFRVVRELD